ncbi:c-type cytochrome [Nitrosophilus kaiyonis]|uniref:c-type cytochrome n=1 Tax=Nitrosophilus kaiyonis TaxID=2930200 RepID=UPI002490894F|nr:c-type cytochrome [Nitrosophilus kaiyonis]
MREIKILIVVVIFTLITYWGVEPFAHSQMHAHHEPATFKYEDLPALAKKGNAQKGAEVFMNAGCVGCHSVKSQGMPAPMDPVAASASYGVNPPDLSTAGALYDEKFLAAIIKNPAHAMKLTHKFNDKRPFPMPNFYGTGGDLEQEVADIVAYLKSIAPKEVSAKEAFVNACGRCHDMKYDNWYVIGEKPKMDTELQKAEFNKKHAEYQANLKKYLGTNPPDLSMYIRSRGHEYIRDFVEDPQKILHGTAMPRVGLTEASTHKVIEYMEKVGDRKKDKRNSLGPWILLYFVIFSLLAYAWKKKIWRDLH